MVWLYSVVCCCIPTSGEMVPNQFSPHGQVVPKNSVPLDKWSLDKGTDCGDPEIQGPNWLGTICSRVSNLFCLGDQFYRDRPGGCEVGD